MKYSITQNQYNALGLLTQVTLSGTASSERNISQYFYNNAGVQTGMRTGLSSENDTEYLTTNYEYDAWMRLVRTTDSTGYHSGTVTYDLNGNVLTTTDANGNVTTNTYDALNRVLTSDAVHPTDASKNVSKSYTYDNMGRVTQAVNNDVTTTYTYDSLGRKYSESEYSNDYDVFRGYFYEGISQYVKQELTGKNHLLIYSNKAYAYDDEMRVVNVQESGNDITAYTYDANGNKLTETMANGVVSTYSYNKANKVTGIVNTSGNLTISAYEYSYYLDGSDACKVRTENGIMEVTSYEYDGLKRLTQESVTAGSTTDTYAYEYDDYGNRAKMTATGSANFTTVYDYKDAQGNYTALLQKEIKTSADEMPLPGQEVTPEQTVYTYDANGSQLTKTTSEKTETNVYNAANQLVGFADGETTASYAYNVNGLRVEKVVDGQRTNHVWDGSQQIVADVIASLYYEAQCYIRGTSLAAAYRYQNAEKSGYTYYVQNAHGDVVNLTDTEGAVTRTYRYDAFGVELSPVTGDVNVFRYCGEYFDAETGTVYLRARYYQASIGRFTQRDTVAGKLSDPLSLNLYTYCQNNPLFYFDPSGHSAWTNFWDEAADCWKVGSSGFRDSWNVGIKSLSSGGKTSQVFASFSQGVVDTFSSQAVSIVKTVRNPGTAIKNVVSDYIAHGKKNPTNWDPATYLGTKISEGIVSQWKASYNLGLNYGLNGVAYSLGQGTTTIAEVAISAYGSDMAVRTGTYIKNNMPRTVKGCITDVNLTQKRFTSEQNTLLQMGKYYDRVGGITMADAEAYMELAREVGLTEAHLDMGHSHGTIVSRNPHLHIGTGSYHIPIKPE